MTIVGGKILVPSSYQFETLKNPQWGALSVASTVTTSDRWVRYDNARLRLIPADYNGTTYAIGYIQSPDYLSTASATVDSRIYLQHQEYLKFAAGAYLLQYRGDENSLRLADQYMKIFTSLVSTSGVVR
jgi:hypothetical protein